MILSDFESLLKEASGLDPASVGASAIERAVRERMAACDRNDPDAYWDFLRTSEIERQELVEAVVVPETWFFRDREAFAALGRLAVQEWLPGHPEGVMRLLSLPCSTGEEAYSMAIALLDAGLSADRFSIDARDISRRALAIASRARYGKNSFRGNELDFLNRYFETTANGYQLAETVRREVHFQPGNLFDGGLLQGVGIYDVIFCRNLLIYFDRATQDRAMEVLKRLLSPRGILFVGPAETSLLSHHGFVSAKIAMAFAFRKAVSVPVRSPKKTVSPPVPASPPVKKVVPVFQPLIMVPPSPIHVSLDEAALFADQGKLAEAAQRCEAYLQAHGPSAQAYYLLGLVRDAEDQSTEAIGFYRKALYLEPAHQETLAHLALLLEKHGDKTGARVLHNRMRRLEQR